jgi:hypothetical protein
VKQIFDEEGRGRISLPVVRAFLGVPEFRHGVRSIEAILDMSRLERAAEITTSVLPPATQLALHTSPADFLRLINFDLTLGEHLEQLARLAHEAFVADMKGKRDPGHPSMQSWDELVPLYKNSNREQAAHIAVKLAAIGCKAVPREDPSKEVILSDEEIEKLAVMEHTRWMDERRRAQPDHKALVPWDRLPEADKEKDRDAVRKLRSHLDEVGLAIVRLE